TPASYQSGLEIAHRPGGGIARIGKERLAFVLAFLVDALERTAREEDLAAHFDAAFRRTLERKWNRPYGAHVGRDVFAPGTVAARGAARESSVLVGQGDAEPVDLQFGDIRNNRVPQGGPPAYALIESAQLVFVVRVVETEHGTQVLDRRKAFRRTTGNALRR